MIRTLEILDRLIAVMERVSGVVNMCAYFDYNGKPCCLLGHFLAAPESNFITRFDSFKKIKDAYRLDSLPFQKSKWASFTKEKVRLRFVHDFLKIDADPSQASYELQTLLFCSQTHMRRNCAVSLGFHPNQLDKFDFLNKNHLSPQACIVFLKALKKLMQKQLEGAA